MAEWVLILWLGSVEAAAPAMWQFTSLARCEAAGQAAVEGYAKWFWRRLAPQRTGHFICVER